MTTPSGSRPERLARRRSRSKVTPVQVVAAVVVLAVFIGALVLGGPVGAGIIALLAVFAALMLVLRWEQLDPRIRVMRLIAVFAAVAVAVSVLTRG